MAIIHIAMHDAYVLTRSGLGTPVAKNDPYLPAAARPAFSHPGGGGEPTAASAVAAAASVTLLNLYPSHSDLIDDNFASFCEMWGADAAGHRFGSAVGQSVLGLRRLDGAEVDPDFANPDHMDSAAYGRHREDPLNGGQGFLGVRYGFVRPFAVSAFHPLKKYPAIGSANYLSYHNEVYQKGPTVSSAVVTRTPEEAVIGVYWAYDGVKDIGHRQGCIIRSFGKSRWTNLYLCLCLPSNTRGSSSS